MVSSESSAVIATNGILAVLAVAAVTLRITIRKQKVIILQADDFLILGALVSMISPNIERPLLAHSSVQSR